jgi:sphingomyelin phosphodiesterase 2
MSEQAQIDILGVTCESRLNTFRPKDLEKATDDPNAKRLDYIFTSKTFIDSAKVVLTERIAQHNINYSDHFGVSVSFQLPESTTIKPSTLPQALFNNIREITLSYTIREEKHSLLRICHFFFSLSVCIAMHVGLWFVDQKGSIFVMMFFSTMCAWCGVLDGVIGFIWGRWELRTLREFESEMDLARRVYAEVGARDG